jgi:tryptophan halogenase
MDQACEELKTVYDDVEPLRTIDFNAGRFTNSWIKNCIGLGLSTNFVEPLESTSIFVTIGQLRLLEKFKEHLSSQNEDEINNFNKIIGNNNDAICKFIYLHYMTKRKDSDFWLEFSEKNTPPEGMDLILTDIKDGKLNENSLPMNTSSAFNLESYLHICNGLEMYEEQNTNLPIFPNHHLYTKMLELEQLKNNEQSHSKFIAEL